MKKLFGKKNMKMVSGIVYLQRITNEQLVEDLMTIDKILGNNLYETQQLTDNILRSEYTDSIRVPIKTDKKNWKKIMDSKIKLIATSSVKAIAC